MTVAAEAGTARLPRTATYLGLGLITLAQLMYEIGLTRIFSVTMWYHFAFVAISLALFGLTVGAMIVYLRPKSFPDELVRERLWQFALAFAVSVPVCLIIQLRLPFTPDWNVGGLGSVLLTCSIISIPFVFGGVVVCLALTRFPTRVNRLYAADLVGAAIGCVGFVFLLRWFDGPSAVLAVGALGALAAWLFAREAGNARGLWSCAIAVVLLGGLSLGNAILYNRGDAAIKILWAKGDPDPSHRYENWNSFSRVSVDGDAETPRAPMGWGMSDTLPPGTVVPQLLMVIDSSAATPLTRYTGKSSETDFLRYDITNLVHWVKHDADVLVIGAGGGRDVLSALEFDQNHVTGVEMNGDILRITNEKYGDFTGHLDRHPKVTFVNDEARSYLARTDTRYDIIEISLIDTWAATSAGAYALSENGLYTTDALEVMFDSMKPGGVLSISRWYQFGGDSPLEMYRTAALAAEALKNQGAENPRDHLLIYRSPPNGLGISSATILISPQPFGAQAKRDAAAAARRLNFTPLLTPTRATDEHLARLTVPAGPSAEVARFDEDISPPSDERPFFFQMADIDTLLSGNGLGNSLVTRPVLVLAVLGLAVILLALGLIVTPLLITTRRSAHRGMSPLYVYFAGIGLAFLLVEISQLQRLTIFLGHPTFALTVVLFSLLLASGAGSMLAGRFADTLHRRRPLIPLVGLLTVLVLYSVVQPRVIDAFSDATTPVRIITAIALLVPLGLFMGMPFVIGMHAAATTRKDAPTAFLWGINGAMSVCASVMGMVLALFFGIAVTFWVGVAAYGVAALALATVFRRSPPEDADEPLVEAPPTPALAVEVAAPGA